MTRLLSIALLCLGWLSLGVAQAQVRSFDEIIASGVLKAAVYEQFPPYSYQENNQARGLDVELAQKMAEALGVKLELMWISPGKKLDDDLRNFIWKGHYMRPNELADVMLRVPYDRAFSQRRNDVGELANKQVHMFGPYQRERWQVAHDTRRLPEVPSIAVFAYHPIGVELDSVPSFYMTSVSNGQMRAKTQHFASNQAAFAAMQAGNVDAVMALRGEIDWMLHEANDPQLKAAENAYPEMGRQLWDIGMAVHEANRQLAHELENATAELIERGELQAIYARYGVRYELPELYQ